MTDIVKGMARLICETENVDGFKCTCPVPYEPEGNNWCNHNRAVHQARAALLWLADNVSDEMVQAYRNERESVIRDEWFPSLAEAKTLSAAIRAAAGEEGK
jgi:hypothetical protein